ncbi:MAG: hypothetical protein H6728_04095 [Myxococcales bacterium]|nr:hypothetical protein [Myxococcales bacterium]
MSDPPGKSTRRRSRRDQSQAVSALLRRKMQQAGYDPAFIEHACAAWELFCQVAKPQIRSIQAYAAAMEYVIVLRRGGGQLTQRAVAERYLVSQASIARIHPRILDSLTKETSPSPEPAVPTPPPVSSLEAPASSFVSFYEMSPEARKEEQNYLQGLPLVRERWGALLLLGSVIQSFAYQCMEDPRSLPSHPLFSPLCVRPRRPSDESAVVLVWIDLQRHRLLGWFPTETSHLSMVWDLSLRLVMERPLYGMPRRPVEVALPAVVPFDHLAQVVQPLHIQMVPLERQEIPALEPSLLRILSDVPYAFLEEGSARYQEEREEFFLCAAKIASSLAPLSSEHAYLWGHHPHLKSMAYPKPNRPCYLSRFSEALAEARRVNQGLSSTQKKAEPFVQHDGEGTWWFVWRREEECVLCWSSSPYALGSFMASYLKRRGLDLSQQMQIARFVEQLLRHKQDEAETDDEELPDAGDAKVWELRFQRGANLPMSTRRKLFEEGYEIAHARAFPLLCVYEIGGGFLPFVEPLWSQVNLFLRAWDDAYEDALQQSTSMIRRDFFPVSLEETEDGVISLLSQG